MGIQTGLLCKAYHNTGTQATPVWVETNLIVNLDSKKAWDSIAGSCRKSGGVKQYVLGERDDEISFSLCHDNADTVWEFWRNAAWTNTPVHLEVYDDDKITSGADGSTGTYIITALDDTQQLSSVVEDSFTLKASANGIIPAESGIVPIRITTP